MSFKNFRNIPILEINYLLQCRFFCFLRDIHMLILMTQTVIIGVGARVYSWLRVQRNVMIVTTDIKTCATDFILEAYTWCFKTQSSRLCKACYFTWYLPILQANEQLNTVSTLSANRKTGGYGQCGIQQIIL